MSKNSDFYHLLDNAVKICNGDYVEDFYQPFQSIYPFTTENISGYIDLFKLKNNSLLTVGSSGDHQINAALYDCKDITTIDICPYTKLYIYLKIACLIELTKKEFLRFLCYKGYPSTFKDNKDVFNLKIFYKIRDALRILDYESYLLWDELFQSFNPEEIRKMLFSSDEDRCQVIISCNPYLSSEIAYQEAKEKIKKAKLKFIIGDIFKESINDTFDNIWLSNIGTYKSRHFVKIMTSKMSELLKEDGTLLISYLYQTTKDTKYQEDWQLIYDLEKTFAILEAFYPELITFLGVKGIKFADKSIKDSILISKRELKK